MDNRPVGIFDSGLGGLTAVRALKRMLPDENIIYFGDTGRMPYGGRPREQIRLIARQNLDFVCSMGVKAVLAACGTISSNAQDLLINAPVPTVGVLLPGVRELCCGGARRLGVIATQTSIQSGAFRREILRLCPDALVTDVPCPDFVPMIEAGHCAPDDPVVIRTVRESLRPIADAGCEALLLGCTHYGIIAKAIENALPGVRLAAASDAAAAELAGYLRENGLLSEAHTGDICFTSGATEDFEALAPVLLGGELPELRCVPPMPTEVL